MSAHATAAIVAAYNEERTIGEVVTTLVECGVFRDVIVVSDGSSDRTAEIARAAGATLVRELQPNRGKGAALLEGVAQTDAPILFFCDADLRGLTRNHVERIMKPVVSGRLAMCVGLRDRGPILTWCSQFMPLVGGERALVRRVIEDIPDRFVQGYRVETAMNYYCQSHGLRYGTVKLPGLTIVRKMQKVGVIRGLVGYVRMTWQVVMAMADVRMARTRGEF